MAGNPSKRQETVFSLAKTTKTPKKKKKRPKEKKKKAPQKKSTQGNSWRMPKGCLAQLACKASAPGRSLCFSLCKVVVVVVLAMAVVRSRQRFCSCVSLAIGGNAPELAEASECFSRTQSLQKLGCTALKSKWDAMRCGQTKAQGGCVAENALRLQTLVCQIASTAKSLKAPTTSQLPNNTPTPHPKASKASRSLAGHFCLTSTDCKAQLSALNPKSRS